MRIAKDGRLCKPGPRDWPQILRRLLPADFWKAVLGRVRRSEDPRVQWRPQYVLLCLILMGWVNRPSLGERFSAARQTLVALFPNRKRPGETIQGLVQAGRRLTQTAFHVFWEQLRERIKKRLGPDWLWHGWQVFAADGSRVDAPRTAANEDGLGCAGRAKAGPQWWVTTLIHLPSRMLWSWRQGPGTSSERHHLLQMLTDLPLGPLLLLADAGYVGHALLSARQARGIDFAIRCGANVTLLVEGCTQHIVRCGSDRVVYLWPNKHRGRSPPMLRFVTLTRGKRKIYLLTNVLDSQRLSRRMVGELYAARWGVEIHFRDLKQTLERRKVRACTTETGELELAGNLLALGLLLAQAAWLQRGRVGRVSVAALLRTLRDVLAALRWGGDTDWFVRAARAALRDEYERCGSKRARDWPHKKHEQPAGAPRIRKLTRREKIEINRWKQASKVQIG